MKPEPDCPPIVNQKYYQTPSVFKPENLLREARRQKSVPEGEVPHVVLLDPDGDIATWLRQQNQAEMDPYWAGYHTAMYRFQWNGTQYGVIPCAVGAPFAVLVAEQLFVSACQLLISITSAGTVAEPSPGSRSFRVISDAVRDEGTSYHYLPPSDSVSLQPRLTEMLQQCMEQAVQAPVGWARSWTTDAPYRETEPAVEAMRSAAVDCVEMEAAALYAFARARQKPVVCLAHITNAMAQQNGDFEKGEGNGTIGALQAADLVVRTLSAVL